MPLYRKRNEKTSYYCASQQFPINPIIIGQIGSAYGVKGWLKIFSFSEKDKNIFSYQPWFIKDKVDWKPIHLENWRLYKKNLIVKIRNIEEREIASLLTNHKIFIETSLFLNSSNEEYYWKDILGCRVITINGYQLGTVVNLIETGSNDVLVVKANHLATTFLPQERLIPCINEKVIKSIDIMNRLIKVEWDLNF
ncbi:ribosome maturation factor RimM [Sodalis sp. CWE]|nr:ribosome maturation factor RimM [Sodalis sp. CWE]